MSSDKRNSIITLVVIVIIIAGVFLLPKAAPSKYTGLDSFAQCLTDKGVVMYGAYWCVHCKNQKALFGDSFKKVTYVECTEKAEECTAVGVNSYPTWIFPDFVDQTGSTTPGRIFRGEVPLETLADESGCELGIKQ